jgi:hypothetical protein
MPLKWYPSKFFTKHLTCEYIAKKTYFKNRNKYIILKNVTRHAIRFSKFLLWVMIKFVNYDVEYISAIAAINASEYINIPYYTLFTPLVSKFISGVNIRRKYYLKI